MIGQLLFQFIAYALAALVVWKVVLPGVREARESHFLPQALVHVKRKKFLVTYITFALLTYLATAFIDEDANARNIAFIAAFSGMFSLVTLFVLLRWVISFFQKGKQGLFAELYLTGSKVQDMARPFLWSLLGVTVAVDILATPLSVIAVWRYANFYHVPLVLLQSVAGSFVFLTFIFYVAVRGLGVLRIILSAIGAGLLVGVLVLGLMGLQYALGFRSDLGFNQHTTKNIASSWPLDTSNSIIACLLVGSYLYHAFNRADPRRWLPKEDRR